MTPTRLLTAAKILYAHAVHGLPVGAGIPAWLEDCGKDIEAAAALSDEQALENSKASLADAPNNPVPLTLSDAGSDAEGRE